MHTNEVIENMMTRTSVRSYEDRPVEKEKIITLLKAGMAAPSAVDRRPWHFYVVNDRQMLAAIKTATPNAAMAAKAPLAIIVCGDMDKALVGNDHELWAQDASAATENILLAAHAMGLSAVWTATYPVEERVEAITSLFDIPQHLIPFNTIVIGYPKTEGHPKDKWNEADVNWDNYKETNK